PDLAQNVQPGVFEDHLARPVTLDAHQYSSEVVRLLSACVEHEHQKPKKGSRPRIRDEPRIVTQKSACIRQSSSARVNFDCSLLVKLSKIALQWPSAEVLREVPVRPK